MILKDQHSCGEEAAMRVHSYKYYDETFQQNILDYR